MRDLLTKLDPEDRLHKMAYAKRNSIEEKDELEMASFLEHAAEGKAVFILKHPNPEEALAIFTELTLKPHDCSPYYLYHFYTAKYEELQRIEKAVGWGGIGNSDYAHTYYTKLIASFEEHCSGDDEANFNAAITADDRLPGLFASIYFDEYHKRSRHVERYRILDEAMEWAGLGAKGIRIKDCVKEPIACMVMGEGKKIREEPESSYMKYLRLYQAHTEIVPEEPTRDYPIKT
jgi:hypothetical protein